MDNEIVQLIGQILGFVAVGVSFILYQLKSKKWILVVHTVICILLAANYFILGAYSGMAMNLVGIARNLVYSNKQIFKGSCWKFIMCGIILVIGIITATGPASILVIAGITINSYALSFKNPQHLRISLMFTSPMVLIYDIIYFSLGGILFEAVSLISAAIGLYRYREKKTEA